MDANDIPERNQNTNDLSWDENELNEFRKLVLQDTEIKGRTDDIFLLSFLRARKYDRERALKLLKNYYSVRRSQIHLRNLRPFVMKKYLDMHMIGVLRVEPDLVIGLGRVSHWDATKANVTDIGRCMLLFMDLELNNHPIQVHGLHVLVDVKTLTWRHVIQFTPRIIYHALTWFYQSLPIRYKSVHFINVNKYLNSLVKLVFPLIPEKIRKRFHFYDSNIEALHKMFDPKYLPAEFGGELPLFDATDEVQRLLDNEEFFIENEKYWNDVKSS